MRYKLSADERLQASGDDETLDLSTLAPDLSLDAHANVKAVTFALYNAGTVDAEVAISATTAGLGATKIRPDETVILPDVYPEMAADTYVLKAPDGADVLIQVWLGIA